MGLTIHYSGKLRNPAELSKLIEEAADIAKTMQWDHERLPAVEEWPLDGVIITPEGSEPVWLTFHTEHGLLINPIMYSMIRETTHKDVPEDAVSGVFTKTQYAGAEVHIAVVRLLRHLSEKYFSTFEVVDESKFWEMRDDDDCRRRFGE